MTRSRDSLDHGELTGLSSLRGRDQIGQTFATSSIDVFIRLPFSGQMSGFAGGVVSTITNFIPIASLPDRPSRKRP